MERLSQLPESALATRASDLVANQTPTAHTLSRRRFLQAGFVGGTLATVAYLSRAGAASEMHMEAQPAASLPSVIGVTPEQLQRQFDLNVEKFQAVRPATAAWMVAIGQHHLLTTLSPDDMKQEAPIVMASQNNIERLLRHLHTARGVQSVHAESITDEGVSVLEDFRVQREHANHAAAASWTYDTAQMLVSKIQANWHKVLSESDSVNTIVIPRIASIAQLYAVEPIVDKLQQLPTSQIETDNRFRVLQWQVADLRTQIQTTLQTLGYPSIRSYLPAVDRLHLDGVIQALPAESYALGQQAEKQRKTLDQLNQQPTTTVEQKHQAASAFSHTIFQAREQEAVTRTLASPDPLKVLVFGDKHDFSASVARYNQENNTYVGYLQVGREM